MGILIAAQMVCAAFVVSPGPFSIDEITYHAMVRSLLSGGGFFIENGFGELPSAELTSMWIKAVDDHLVAQYPYLSTLVSAPFYWAFGLRGLFVVNSLAFIASTLTLAWLLRRLFADAAVAYFGAIVFAIGTFAWEYSMAAWPHALAAFLTLAAFSCAMLAVRQDGGHGGRSLAWAIAAGVVAGIGVGVRADALIAAIALMLVFLFADRVRIKELFAYGLGLIPGLSFCSYAAYVRWGTLSPVGYGETTAGQSGRYLPLAVLGALGVAAALWLKRPGNFDRALARKREVAIGLGVAVMAVIAITPVRELVLRFLHGLAVLVVDLRLLPERAEPGMMRSREGAVIYFGGIKKAFAQSLPYLSAVLVPIILAVKQREKRFEVAALYLIPLVIVGFFSLTAWHGGMCFNIRYFVPVLPFVAGLTALAWRWIDADLRRRCLNTAVGCALGGAVYWLLRPDLRSVSRVEIVTLDFSLVIALVCVLCLVLRAIRPGDRTARAAAIVLGAAICWAGLVGIDYDARSSLRIRDFSASSGAELAKLVEDDSLVFVAFLDHLAAVTDHRRNLIIAAPWNDRFRDFPALARHHAIAGRKVYAALAPPTWRQVQAAAAAAGLRTTTVGTVAHYEVRRIEVAP